MLKNNLGITHQSDHLKEHSAVSGDKWKKVSTYRFDDDPALKVVISVYNDDPGASMGGQRWKPYDDLDGAMSDALLLSRGMGYKNALIAAGVQGDTPEFALGGGKAVIWIDDDSEYTPERQDKFAQALGMFNESITNDPDHVARPYITGPDSNTNLEMMARIAQTCPDVACLPPSDEPRFQSEAVQRRLEAEGVSAEDLFPGNSTPATVEGVLHAQRAALQVIYGSESFEGRRVAIQGAGGAVGGALARRVLDDGAAKLYVSEAPDKQDTLEQLVSEYGADRVVIVEGDDILYQDVDLLAPCAYGGIFSDDNIGDVKATIIAGAANNQQVDPTNNTQSQHLFDYGGVYIPDYLVNGAGVRAAGWQELFLRDPENYPVPTKEFVGESLREIGLLTSYVMDQSYKMQVDCASIADAIVAYKLQNPDWRLDVEQDLPFKADLMQKFESDGPYLAR